MFRSNLDEMNVHPVDLGHELRYGVQSRLTFLPVVIRLPIACEFLHRRELHTLRFIPDRFPLGPLGRFDALAQAANFRSREAHTKWADRARWAGWRLRSDIYETQRARGHGCRRGTAKATAIEVGCLVHGEVL